MISISLTLNFANFQPFYVYVISFFAMYVMGSSCCKKKDKKDKNKKLKVENKSAKNDIVLSKKNNPAFQGRGRKSPQMYGFEGKYYSEMEQPIRHKTRPNSQACSPLLPDNGDFLVTEYSHVDSTDDNQSAYGCRFHFPRDGDYDSIHVNHKRIPLGWTYDSVTGKYAYVFMLHRETTIAIMELFSKYPRLNRLKGNCYGKLYRSDTCSGEVTFVVIKSKENDPIKIDFALKYLIQFGVKFFRDYYNVVFHEDPMQKLGREDFDDLALKCGLELMPDKYIRRKYFGFDSTTTI